MSVKADKSLERLRARAERGDLDAQCRLADLYLGQETQEGNRAALPWLRKAARQGNRNACFNLGLYYETGRGVPQSNRLSFRWYLKAAEPGDSEAQRIAGYCHHEGVGTRRDFDMAIQKLSEMDTR